MVKKQYCHYIVNTSISSNKSLLYTVYTTYCVLHYGLAGPRHWDRMCGQFSFQASKCSNSRMIIIKTFPEVKDPPSISTAKIPITTPEYWIRILMNGHFFAYSALNLNISLAVLRRK